MSIARYSFIQLSELRHHGQNENQASKRQQMGFEPGLSRLRVRHSTTEQPISYDISLIPSMVFVTEIKEFLNL